MLLEKLTLHNFGIYRGRHEIDLAPSKASKPIILFGALNGSGKTTILDALQLVLYGKRAQCSNRGDLAYDEFLRRSIHRGSDPHDGAAIELKFRHRSGGVEYQYRVHRLWTATERTVKERVEVLRNDKPDQVLTDQWADFVEELIPVRLSKFFFFDGEQIEELADLDHSAEVLASAIQSLLGLDLVDQLIVDLKVVERRNREKLKPSEERAALQSAREEVERLEERCGEARTQSASQKNVVERLAKQLAEQEESFRIAGGDVYHKREQIESEREEVSSRLKESEDRLIDMSAGIAPLLLVRELIEETSRRSAATDATTAKAVVAVLAARDSQVLQVTQSSGANEKVLSALREFLRQDLDARRISSDEAAPLVVDASVKSDLGALLGGRLAETLTQVSLALEEHDRLKQRLAVLDRKLASVPIAEAVSYLIQKIEEKKSEKLRAEGVLEHLDAEVSRLETERERKWNAYARLSAVDLKEQQAQGDAGRIIAQSESMRTILANFKTASAARHVRRIEENIVNSLGFLLRKESLIRRVHIDPETYRIVLFDRHEQPLTPERLSAGERQLLAVATIWGIARAAGRQLPVVIDTPLGRLDSVHRNRLVERYFPAASHQVLLLSTDEEIDQEQYDKLKSSVGRSYLLRFHEELDSTMVEHGYFYPAA